MPQGPLFLARAVYRRRRLRDAARLLPVIGLLLVILPAFGHDGDVGRDGGHADTAVYLFVVWAVMIAVAAALAPALSKSDADGERAGDAEALTDPVGAGPDPRGNRA